MQSLFPIVEMYFNFNATNTIKVNGNHINYHIGFEKGKIEKYLAKDFGGYEFTSENGSTYFISTSKGKIPSNYDAAFYIDTHKTEKLSIDYLQSCPKEIIYIKPPSKDKIIDSWLQAFHYKNERKYKGNIIKGLRPPQIGALHAILSHWSITKIPSLVVMPTGTGKTETMLSLTIAGQLDNLLVIVPSDSLRVQISDKFTKLGILKEKEFEIVNYSAFNPIVGILSSSFKTPEDAEEFCTKCNIIVATTSILTQCRKNNHLIFDKIIQLSNYLIVDEAHHCEASTWDDIATVFLHQKKPVLKFTATPFRNDKKRLKGKCIYDYPLSLAQQDGSFKEINFIPIVEFNENKVHQIIAQRAIAQLEIDKEAGYEHILMARVDEIEKAYEVFEIYKGFAKYNPVLLHSKIKGKERKVALEKIKNGEHKIIVCVNMLGEGYDLPQLKICALHVIHKNITTSIQFFGRFVRSSSKNIGNATIIANIGDNKFKDDLLKKLYAKDADWNRILKMSNEGSVGNLNKNETFFQKFVEDEIPNKIPIRNITPALSTVVYKVSIKNPIWSPEKHLPFFEKRKTQSVYAYHEEKDLMVIISRSQDTVRWGMIDDLINNIYDLFIVYFNRKQGLLFINSTNNGTLYEELATMIMGRVYIINESDIYKSLHEVEQLELFNLGVRPITDESISYTQLYGRDVATALDDITKETKTSVNLFGKGYFQGERMTIGCSSKGRVWSRMVKSIPEFCEWCDTIGEKLINQDIDVKNIYKFIGKPERRKTLPKNCSPISILWNDEMYYKETDFLINGESFYNYNIILNSKNIHSNTISFSIVDSDLNISEFNLILESNKESRGFKYIKLAGRELLFSYGRHNNITLEEFFYNFPPIIRFSNASKMYNDIFLEYKYDVKGFDIDRIITKDWSALGIIITKESQFDKSKSIVRKDSIQFHMISELKQDQDYKLIIDDDDSGEISDIIGIKYFENDYSKLVIDLFHCKYSKKKTAGARVDDLYEVCGQAQRGFHWKHKAINLITHINHRESLRTKKDKPSRFQKGNNEELLIIKNMIESGMCQLIFNIHIVQPGVSKSQITDEQLKLLGATDLLLKNTGNGFNVIMSM